MRILRVEKLFSAVVSLTIVTAFCSLTAFGQTQRERFWLAGCYDAERVLIYFQSVRFHHSVPANARRLPGAVVFGFFDQVELPANYIAQFQKGPEAERFALGDQYDLLLDDGRVVPVTVSTLVGTEGDEDVGNDSYIGAVATVSHPNDLLSTRGYYVVRRHQEVPENTPKPDPNSIHAGFVDGPVRIDIETRIASMLTERMKTMADGDERREAERISPALAIQPFRLADGNLRYYVRAEWKSGSQADDPSYLLAAWMAAKPTLRILALETRTSGYGFASALPKLLNVIDLGGGRTAIIVLSSRDDSESLDLLEYRDRLSLRHMPVLQSIGSGE